MVESYICIFSLSLENLALTNMTVSRTLSVWTGLFVEHNQQSVRRLLANIFSKPPKHKLVLLEAGGGFKMKVLVVLLNRADDLQNQAWQTSVLPV